MKKFKKIIVGAMLVMALGTFTACGNNDDNVNDTTGTQDNVTNDAANDETTGSNKNKNNNNNDNDTDNAGNAVGDAMEDVGDAAVVCRKTTPMTIVQIVKVEESENQS